MSFAEMKEQVHQLTEDERLELAAVLYRINCENDPEWQAEMTRRIANGKAGKGVPREELMQRLGLTEEDLRGVEIPR